MGSAGSQPRRQYSGQSPDAVAPPPPVYAPNSGYQPAYGSGSYAPFPFQPQYPAQPGGWHASGPQAPQFYPGNRQGPYLGPSPGPLVPRPIQMPEPQKTLTIRNDVNVKRGTVKIHADPQQQGHFLVSFAFDATVAGSFCIFFVVKEGEACSLTPVHPHLFTPVRVRFEKGLNQKYSQESGSGVNLRSFQEAELLTTTPADPYPLVIRTETNPHSPPLDTQGTYSDTPGSKLPKWVQCQTTYCWLVKQPSVGGGTNEYSAKVGKQKIWVEGTRYELQEIYGIESSSGSNSGGGGGGEQDAGRSEGKECVICLSEPRNTTVLPCRHMCMCSECASVLQYQSKKCPICRQPVERLLEIRVAGKQEGSQVDGETKSEGCGGDTKGSDMSELDLGKIVFGSSTQADEDSTLGGMGTNLKGSHPSGGEG